MESEPCPPLLGVRKFNQFEIINSDHFHNFDQMEALKIQILNPKAIQLLKGMQDLNLIKVSQEPASEVKAYLKKMRKNAADTPGLEEISKLVEEVRQERYEAK